jgi:hypothetical protein
MSHGKRAASRSGGSLERPGRERIGDRQPAVDDHAVLHILGPERIAARGEPAATMNES